MRYIGENADSPSLLTASTWTQVVTPLRTW